jgi:hypothetical protein|tara:strand:- start:28063 stop:28416 length:354 start_codon:yes stop_codon:yes gene_type:complete
MPTIRKRLRVYVTAEEEISIKGKADQVGLSISQFLLRLGMNYAMPKAEDFSAWRGIQDLLKVNADLARLGNLLKLAIDERPDQGKDFARLMGEIDKTQKALKASVIEIRDQVQPKRK